MLRSILGNGRGSAWIKLYFSWTMGSNRIAYFIFRSVLSKMMNFRYEFKLQVLDQTSLLIDLSQNTRVERTVRNRSTSKKVSKTISKWWNFIVINILYIISSNDIKRVTICNPLSTMSSYHRVHTIFIIKIDGLAQFTIFKVTK